MNLTISLNLDFVQDLPALLKCLGTEVLAARCGPSGHSGLIVNANGSNVGMWKVTL